MDHDLAWIRRPVPTVALLGDGCAHLLKAARAHLEATTHLQGIVEMRARERR